jgi:hypothetical protein
MSSSELWFGASQWLTYIHNVIELWERLFGVKPSVETMIKIMKVRELLKRGVTPREAIRSVGLG